MSRQRMTKISYRPEWAANVFNQDRCRAQPVSSVLFTAGPKTFYYLGYYCSNISRSLTVPLRSSQNMSTRKQGMILSNLLQQMNSVSPAARFSSVSTFPHYHT